MHIKTSTPPPRRTALLVLGIAAALGGCSSGHQTAPPESREPVSVVTQPARVESLSAGFEVGGVVRARTTATLVSRIVADVQEVLVRPGDHIRAGQVLIRLDAREMLANKARAEAGTAAAEQAAAAASTAKEGAEAGLTLAAATHKRVSDLRTRNSATASELDQANASLKAAEAHARGAQATIRQAEAGVEAARAAAKAAAIALSYTTITAPFDGVVTEKLVEPGNTAAPGAPLMTVEDTKGFRLEVRVDESRVGAIDRSRPVPVSLDSLGHEMAALSGTISEVSRAISPGSHAFLVKIELPESSDLRSGMFGRARFAGAGADRLVIPVSALVRRGQLTSVYVAGSDGRARLRLVNTGSSFGDRVEISAGLDAGEAVVVSPPPTLVDGMPVRASSPAALAPTTPVRREGVTR
jgi:multidrug efflux pump subunit AcrA (membrane-fusion protein)